MPSSNVYTGFTTTGGNTSNSSEFNVQVPWNKGWNFYCNSSKTETVFFPALGWRYCTSAVPINVWSGACYWTAGPYNPYYGWDLHFHAGVVYPLNYNVRSHGFAVRASQEE